jgi:putative membrane protein
LALFALGRPGRRRLAAWLHSRPLTALTSPVGSLAAFSVVLVVTHVPAGYGLALRNDVAHVGEHALYLVAALLMWAPLLGVDPLPHRVGPRTRRACLAAGMVPMLVVGAWLGLAAGVVYPHYATDALHDQRVAAVIMWAGAVPAFLVPALVRRTSRLRTEPAWSRRSAPTVT